MFIKSGYRKNVGNELFSLIPEDLAGEPMIASAIPFPAAIENRMPLSAGVSNNFI